MTIFRYQAMDRNGSRTSAEIESATVALAVEKLQATGLLIIDIRPSGAGLLRAVRRPRISSADIVRFTQQLATLLEAEQPLESALALLERQTIKLPVKEMLNRLLEQVKGGSSLSDAMAEEGQIFTSFYLSLVRAGEAAGMLGQTMIRLANNLERNRTLRSELISALIYPAFLVVGVLGSLVLLLTYVVPQFIPIFRDLNVPLPFITECILALGEFLAEWGSYLLLVLVCGGFWLRFYLRAPSRRRALDALVLRVRVLGPVLLGIETARFALTLGTLLDQQVTLLYGMNITRQVARNQAIEAALEQATLSTKNGHSLSVALDQTRLFPELVVQMISVGEQGGRLASMLLKLADIYDKETQTSIQRFMATLVPTLTVIMTVLVAFIMLAIMLPLLSLTSNI
jgi:general secretion pathway protein F